MLNDYSTGTTVELGRLLESGVRIWDFTYPTPAETVTVNGKNVVVPFNRFELEKKIENHYRFRQIGQETVGRWLHYFQTRMKEIMPYYVQLYEFEAKWFAIEDPLESYNLTETFQQDTAGSGTVSTSGSSGNTVKTENTRKHSDTPQGSITNLDNYMSEATQDQGDQTVTGTDSSETGTNNTGSTTHTLTRRGNIGVQPLGTEVKNIREAFINIDLMIINELKDLFLMIY